MDGTGRKEGNAMKTIWTRPASVFFLAFFCCALWGSAAPFIKFGYTSFSIETNAIDQILMFAGFRFSLAGVLVIAIGSVVCRLAPRSTKGRLDSDWSACFFSNGGTVFFLLYRSGACQRGERGANHRNRRVYFLAGRGFDFSV